MLLDLLTLTGCRVSAVVGACVGHPKTDGVQQYLHAAEERGTERRKTLLDAATETCFVRKEEDAEVAARRSRTRLVASRGR